jgi:hypothetical protein
MGAMQAREMATSMPIEASLNWHLVANLYPSVPVSMVPICVEAIDAYWEDDLDREIYLPNGVYYRGESTVPARAIIINHHLDAWCTEDVYEGNE